MAVHGILLLSSQLYKGSTNRRIILQATLGTKREPSLKITKEKKTGSVVQVVARMPSKYKAQSSKPSITHPPKKKKKHKPMEYSTNSAKREIYSHQCLQISQINNLSMYLKKEKQNHPTKSVVRNK
jgi:hypothetical protein